MQMGNEKTSPNPAQMWDERYSAGEYAYGVEASHHLQNSLHLVPDGSKILFPAEGEGRNAVFAASKGYDVYAFDMSKEGKKKALELARKHSTQIHYEVGIAQEMQYPENHFDAIVLVYAHFPPNVREQIHRLFQTWLKPGGLIILEAFHKDHIEYNTTNPGVGGPRNLDMLFTKELLESDFNDCTTNSFNKEVITISEGLYHQGEASLVRMVARKNQS